MTEDKVCTRCGRCCHYIIPNKDGVMVLKKCKHLVRNFKTHKTICRMYNKRKLLRFQNGIVIDTYKDSEGIKREVWCVWRDNIGFNYKGCPFNKKGGKNFEKYCEENSIRWVYND